MIIDPLATVISYLQADAGLAALVGDRVAAKHRYGEAWEKGDAGLMVRLDGGRPERYLPVHTVRLELRCYAASQVEAVGIYLALLETARATEREMVGPATDGGTALLYWFLPASGPSLLYDPDVGMDFCLAFFEAQVGELAKGG